MRLTKQESDLVCIYYSGSLVATIAQMREALPHIDEPDVLAAAECAIGKLEAISAAAFDTLVSPEASL